MELTDRQWQVFRFMQRFQKKWGFPPTFREIGNYFGIKSPNGVACHMKALEDKGMIRRIPGRARAVRLCEKPGT